MEEEEEEEEEEDNFYADRVVSVQIWEGDCYLSASSFISFLRMSLHLLLLLPRTAPHARLYTSYPPTPSTPRFIRRQHHAQLQDEIMKLLVVHTA